MLQQLFPKYLPYHFLIGVGSNIKPYKNIELALKELLLLSNTFVLSPMMQTEPVGMQSKHKFLNFVIYFPSDLKSSELKEYFNTIETKLGRDRSDPLCKIKDRPIDLDIIIEVSDKTDWLGVIKKSENYYQAPMQALLQSLKLIPQSTLIKAGFNKDLLTSMLLFTKEKECGNIIELDQRSVLLVGK